MNSKKIGIVGSRNFNNYKLLVQTIDKYQESNHVVLIVSGGAKGADLLAERYAYENKILTQIYKPDWKNKGKAAGIIRNKLIADASDIVFAFWDGISPGTNHIIEYCKNKRIKLIIIKY